MDKVKATIIEFIPEIGKTEINIRTKSSHSRLQNIVGWHDRPIQIFDVLQAIPVANENGDYYAISSTGVFLTVNCETGEVEYSDVQWNLLHDYDNQTAEVKAFIGKLIGATE